MVKFGQKAAISAIDTILKKKSFLRIVTGTFSFQGIFLKIVTGTFFLINIQQNRCILGEFENSEFSEKLSTAK